MKSLGRFLLITLVSLATFSCQPHRDLHRKIVTDGPRAPASRNSADLAYELSRQPWCSNNDAASMVLLMVDAEDYYTSFDQRRIALELKGLALAAWNLNANDPVTKGTLAYMLCRALQIKGGLFMRLLPCRRYAYREAVHHGLMQHTSENEPLTGPQVVGIIGRAARLADEL